VGVAAFWVIKTVFAIGEWLLKRKGSLEDGERRGTRIVTLGRIGVVITTPTLHAHQARKHGSPDRRHFAPITADAFVLWFSEIVSCLLFLQICELFGAPHSSTKRARCFVLRRNFVLDPALHTYGSWK
jgi:hypothetical protein